MTSPQSTSSVLGKRTRSDDDQNGATKQKSTTRRKAACQACRARKVKCDQARPKCGFCVSNAAECVYIELPDEKVILDPATRALVNRLSEIQHGIDRINSRMDATDHTSPTQNNGNAKQFKVEPREDYLEIPTSRTTADAVLTWPVFGGVFEPNCLVSALDAFSDGEIGDSDTLQLHTDPEDVPQQRVPTLIDRFLSYVHTKNPILDVDALVHAGRRAAEDGFTWNAESCLVLLACALGTIARAFTEALGEDEDDYASKEPIDRLDNVSAAVLDKDQHLAETFFHLASRRLGLVRHTVVGCQCHFFAGVYLMYTFRPLEAWARFYEASTCYQFFLKTVGGPSSERPKFYDAERLQQLGHVQRRMEQSLYWSCFKSEIEMRIDIPLMQSSICQFQYPAMFPSPPCKPPTSPAVEEPPDPPWHQVIEATYGKDISSFNELRPVLSHSSTDTSSPGSHSLYNEEESWFYYLTEVALRRIENRIINTFYLGSRDAWMDIGQWVPLAKEFEAQISMWSTTLPPAMQNFSDPRGLQGNPNTARIQAIDAEPQRDPEGNRASASMELSWCTENRLLEMQSCLYQPFLYHSIHSMLAGPASVRSAIPPSYQTHYQEFVRAGITCNLKILRWRTLHHRHHGIWFDLRGVMTAIVILCAIARSGTSRLPSCLFQRSNETSTDDALACGFHEHHCITFDTVFKRLRYWEGESRDIKMSIKILSNLVDDTRAQLVATPLSA